MGLHTPNIVAEESADMYDYAALIRAAMRHKGINKTALWKAKTIRKCTWASFEERLDSGEILLWELKAMCLYLEIENIRASLTLRCADSADDYFEPTYEAAAEIARLTMTNLAEQMIASEGNFSPIRVSICNNIARMQVSGILEHNNRVNAAQDGQAYVDRRLSAP